MRKIIYKAAHLLIISLAHLLINTSIFAQAPQKMSYQAVIRNSNDSLLISTPIGMRISLVQSSPTGTVVFSETQTTTTNANGLVSLQIGMGTAVNGTFASIDWAAGPYYVKTETDLSGGTNYTIISSNELMSVPYALFSANGTPGPAGPQGSQGLTGATGPQGNQGPQGIAGTIGNDGATGPAGAQGPTGLTGAQGIQGETGAVGATGAQGDQGIQGIKGDQGIQGETGATGSQGIAGINGNDGAVGATGATGPQGLMGETGPQGEQGPMGWPGMNGMPGQMGPQGEQGPMGWPGMNGMPGQMGPQGEQGPMGPMGWGMPGMDGMPGPQGPQGEQGPMGPMGWGMPGMDGMPGPTGPQGPAGADGAVGATGATGAQGATGPAGSFPPGTVAGEMNYWNGTAWVTVAPGINGQYLTLFNGVPTWGTYSIIGQPFLGGIAAYILKVGDPGYDANVQHGLIAAPYDQSTGAAWGCNGTALSGADGTAIGTGNQNTIDIMNGCSEAGTAARICGDLVLGGYSDWYLPSRNELSKLQTNRVAIGGFASTDYWSSTESTDNLAWTVPMSMPSYFTNSKGSSYRVRAIRAF